MSIVAGNTFLIRTANGRFDMLSVSRASLIPSPVTINSVVASASPYTYPVTASDVSGTTITNGINYKVYSFTSTSVVTTYTVNYSCANATQIYVLAVGGGGSGGSGGGGGGGAGGVVMNPINIPAGSGAINISVGAGGIGVSPSTKVIGITGTTTTLTFPSNSSANIFAYGGGGGGQDANIGTTNGSSSGGNGASVTTGTTITSVPPITNNYNYGNYGGGNPASGSYGAGGGGAGTVGFNSVSSTSGGIGGSGIQCFLPGIKDFAPSGTSYSTYYWGGGGGGAADASKIGGNGGIGGGGGGGVNSGSSGISSGGYGGINLGGVGNGTNGGNGGVNTGSGGGALWNGGTISGAGGSGIVIIAFPSATAVTSNQTAVLPTSIISSNLYNATLNNATLTSTAYNSIKGAYACRLLNYNYFGPIFTLRHTLDTIGLYTQNFYSDICGNIGTGYLGTGLSVSNWLSVNGANTTYAYVTKWYNQGMDVSFNSATQYNTLYQPIYDVNFGVINFGYWGAGTGGTSTVSNGGVAALNAGYLNLNRNSMPYGTNDPSFTYITRFWNYGTNNANTQQQLLAFGPTYGSINLNNNGSPSIKVESAYNPTSAALSSTSGNSVISYKYTSFNTVGNNNNYVVYLNNVPGTIVGATTANNNVQNAIISIGNTNDTTTGANYRLATGTTSATTTSYFLQAQLYNLYGFKTALSDADRNLVEATPYQFSQLPSITLSLFTLTSTTFSFTWSSVTNATTYIAYINGSAYGSVASGQVITPGYTGPWQINVYAYNSTNNLLASGYTITPIDWYKLDTGDIVGSTVNNYTTSSYDGILSGNGVMDTSKYKFGTSSFYSAGGTGVTTYIKSTQFTFSGNLTISFWIYINSSNPSYYDLFGIQLASLGAPAQGYSIANVNPGNFIRVYINGSTITRNMKWGDDTTLATSVPLQTWVHMAYVISTTTMTLYLNGSSKGVVNNSVNMNNGVYYSSIATGLIYNNSFTGWMDDFRINNSALSSSQIAGIYNYNPIIPSMTINSVSTSASPYSYPVTAADVYGSTTTNGVNYNVYSFTSVSTTTSYTMNYSCASASIIYVLAVGGGGGGGSYVGSGGGAGGVVMLPVTVPPGNNQTITINVGTGGNNATFSGSTLVQTPTNGGSSTIIFNATGGSATTPASITALGGDFGTTSAGNVSAMIYGSGGASSGGGTGYANNWYPTWTTTSASYAAVNTNYNFGNKGGAGYKTTGGNGGGGGAGGAGPDVTSSALLAGTGGPGIKCVLPGINTFTPSGTAYGTYYWGGGGAGGGGAGGSTYGGNGGIGGGGGGASQSYTYNVANGGTGGGSSLNVGANASAVTVDLGGNAGANTGGGGGGSWVHNAGAGGSGIVLIAIPNIEKSVTQSILLSNYNMALPAQTANTASTANTAPTSWTVTGSGAYYILNGTGGSYNFNYCPYQQYFFTSSTTSVVLSQTIALTAKTYTLTYCAAVNSSYTASSQFTIAIGSITPIFTSALTATNTAWNVYSYTFTVPTAGSYAVTLTFGCSVGITQILIA